ncbi:MAG: PrsW family intramembrane metalloprotease [Planctomycetaceae bacterium]|nr:PrsW family intramembrane metalloprotease [Planctomycetaceae bacterium]
MPIRITCSDCGKTLKVPERLAGKKGRCPGCQAVVSIPTPAETFEREIDPPTKRQRPQQRATTPESTSDDEFGFLDDPALEEDDAESTYSVGSTAPSLPPRTVGGGKQKQPGKTFQAAIEERGPKRQTYKEFTSVDAEPAGRRDHLFFVFMLALIPLAWSIFLPQETVADRVIQQIEEADGDPDQLDAEEIAELFADDSLPGAHLSADSWMHWSYAGVATVVFLGLLITISGRSATTYDLLVTGIVTGTAGILMLLAIQWIAFHTFGFWLRGRGILILLFMIVKFIGFSYVCALDPDTGFLSSFFGFTMGVGLCEELCKAIPVVWYVTSPRANWKGAMLVGMASGIGFGISEGITYSSQFYNGYAGWQIYLVRFASCVTLHAVWAGAVGLLMFNDQTYCTDIDWEAALMFVVKYLSIAMVLHGLYDTLLKKELEVWALLVAVVSWVWLAMLFYRQRDHQLQTA